MRRLIPRMNTYQNTKYALVVAEYPKDQYRENDKAKWGEFLGTVMSPFPQPKNTQRIHDNIWQIPLPGYFIPGTVLVG